MSKPNERTPPPDFGKWKQAIGDFMVSFNECEYWVYQYIALLVTPHLADLINEERLDKRSRAAHAAIKDERLTISPEFVDGVFKRLKDLANYRNILAHNAPMLSVYESTGDSNEISLAIELTTHKGKETTLDEIWARAEDARELDADMLRLFQQIFAERPRTDRIVGSAVEQAPQR